MLSHVNEPKSNDKRFNMINKTCINVISEDCIRRKAFDTRNYCTGFKILAERQNLCSNTFLSRELGRDKNTGSQPNANVFSHHFCQVLDFSGRGNMAKFWILFQHLVM